MEKVLGDDKNKKEFTKQHLIFNLPQKKTSSRKDNDVSKGKTGFIPAQFSPAGCW